MQLPNHWARSLRSAGSFHPEDSILVVRRRGMQESSITAFVFSITLAMCAMSVISFCIASRVKHLGKLKHVTLARWLILFVYGDSWAFVFSSTILQAIGLNRSEKACDTAILLCLFFYLSSKFLYFFLVERVWIVQGGRGPRRKDRLYLFNALGMLLPYCIVICLTFIFRRAEINSSLECRIGLRLEANIPLLIFDISINVFLTTLFLRPLRRACSFANGSGKLREIARRTFIGSAFTLLITVANLITLLIMQGREPGWICFACCNGDVLFSALVLHWVTGIDNDSEEPIICRICKAKVSKQTKSHESPRPRHFGRANPNLVSQGATATTNGITAISNGIELGSAYNFGGIVMTECTSGGENAVGPGSNGAGSKGSLGRSKSRSKNGRERTDWKFGGTRTSVSGSGSGSRQSCSFGGGGISLGGGRFSWTSKEASQITASTKSKNRPPSLTFDSETIPSGRICCRTETTQDRVDIETLEVPECYFSTVVTPKYHGGPPPDLDDDEEGFPTVLAGPGEGELGGGGENGTVIGGFDNRGFEEGDEKRFT